MFKKLTVAGQNTNNMFKMTGGDSGCCGDTVTECQYTATYTQANSTTLLNIIDPDGTARALPLVLAGASTAAQAQAAILAALIAAGYEDDGNPDYPGVVVTDLGTTLQIVITGNAEIVSLVASGGTSTFDADCTLAYLCTFTRSAYTGGASGAAATDLYINGVAYNLGTITPGTTSAGSVSTAVQTQLTAAGVSGTASTVANGSTDYAITITGAEQGTTFKLNGTFLTRSACAQSYV